MAVVNISGYSFYCDDEDLELFNRFSWKLHRNRGEPAYLSTTVMFHRLVTNAPKGSVVDHINNDGMDNRKSNLRIVTHAENMKNKVPAWKRKAIAKSHKNR